MAEPTTAAPLTVGALRRALRGISDDASVVVHGDGHWWAPIGVEHRSIGGTPGQVVLSDG